MDEEATPNTSPTPPVATTAESVLQEPLTVEEPDEHGENVVAGSSEDVEKQEESDKQELNHPEEFDDISEGSLGFDGTSQSSIGVKAGEQVQREDEEGETADTTEQVGSEENAFEELNEQEGLESEAIREHEATEAEEGNDDLDSKEIGKDEDTTEQESDEMLLGTVETEQEPEMMETETNSQAEDENVDQKQSAIAVSDIQEVIENEPEAEVNPDPIEKEIEEEKEDLEQVASEEKEDLEQVASEEKEDIIDEVEESVKEGDDEIDEDVEESPKEGDAVIEEDVEDPAREGDIGIDEELVEEEAAEKADELAEPLEAKPDEVEEQDENSQDDFHDAVGEQTDAANDEEEVENSAAFEEVDSKVDDDKTASNADEADVLSDDRTQVVEKGTPEESVDPMDVDAEESQPERESSLGDIEMHSVDSSEPKSSIQQDENDAVSEMDVAEATETPDNEEAVESEAIDGKDVVDEIAEVEDVVEESEETDGRDVDEIVEDHQAEEAEETEGKDVDEIVEDDQVVESEETDGKDVVDEAAVDNLDEADVSEEQTADESTSVEKEKLPREVESEEEESVENIAKTIQDTAIAKEKEQTISKEPEEAMAELHENLEELPESVPEEQDKNIAGSAEVEATPQTSVAEHEDNDVCLIPDSDQVVTPAEKKKALLARQDAEKAEEIAAQKEKQNEEEADASINSTATEEAANDEAPPEEPKHKIIIASTISKEETCVKCNSRTKCGFRYKHAESGEYHYLCGLTCCTRYLEAAPGKYFIRRKKFLVEDTNSERKRKCIQCKESKPSAYYFRQDDEEFYICNDDCFNLLTADEPDKFKLKRHSIRVRNIGATLSPGSSKAADPESRIVARTAAEAEIAKLDRSRTFVRRCADCCLEVENKQRKLQWESMDFCHDVCLAHYQITRGSVCKTCNGNVSQQSMGKYCVRFGFDILQFCCAGCLNKYKKGLKNCSCCQKDISGSGAGFLAPIGDNDQFKDFCSQACLRKYDYMCNPKKRQRTDTCAVCSNEKVVRVEMDIEGKEHHFCSNPCFSAFKFVSNICTDQCTMCSKHFERKAAESFTIFGDKRPKVFCSRICFNGYINTNRKIVSCHWCKVKKYNFDMVSRHKGNRDILTCSLNCLKQLENSSNSAAPPSHFCDNCEADTTLQYHLPMSDNTVRQLCTYQCVMQFQSQFSADPKNASDPCLKNRPVPTGVSKRVKQPTTVLPKPAPTPIQEPLVPVIANVASLALTQPPEAPLVANVVSRRGRPKKIKPNEDTPAVPPSPVLQIRSVRQKVADMPSPRPSPLPSPSPPPSPPPPSLPTLKTKKRSLGMNTSEEKIPEVVHTKTKIVTIPPLPPLVRNVQTMCTPQMVSTGTDCKPKMCNAGVQTDEDFSSKILIPVPVPIYVPQPMYMYSAPFPVPVPIPLPIPVPVFIPTTRNSAQGIMKEIKKIQDKMPADPFEAELLMMAEMVADEKRDSDSDSDEETKPDMSYAHNSIEQSNAFGEDVLQMALKMASGDYEEGNDLETSMTTNTITNPPPGLEHQDEMGQMIIMDTQNRGGRGRKRNLNTSPSTPRNNRSPVKRVRRDATPNDQLQQVVESSPQPVQPTEKPDVNMCLKYTFGVNAWKQWVMTKNADIEKSSIRRRAFKTELLQMTADELNYSLCLFVKEVRKPNGTEYAPDTIYYLVLGIQQYLYENGRIDNIFTDPYYERFTDCLDEVAKKFSILYNDSQYIVTRVEEAHLWECKQLGAHSPHVLLSTLMFFNTKHFNLTTVDEHMQLSFSHIMKHWKRTPQNVKTPTSRNVLLRFYPPQSGLDANPRKKKVYEQQENEENPLRCPVRLYEFYLSKCPESVKTRNDVFYLQPERSCVPDSPVWYSTQPLSREALQKMLHRVKMVKEINIALLTS